MVEAIVFSAAVIYVGDKILGHYIQEVVWRKRIWYKMFPPKTFRNELYKTINETIDEYELSHPCDKNGTQFPFYHSEILINILLDYVLFNKQVFSLDAIQQAFQDNPNIIKPTQQDLEDFFSLFIRKVNSNKELSRLFIDKNYKNRIFEISGKIETILGILLKSELTPDVVYEKLKEQTQFQIDKQKKSGKYIPGVFIETNELKDHLRYFVAPFIFIEKVYDEINNMKFGEMNRKLQLRKHNETFNFSISRFSLDKIKSFSEDYHLFYNYIYERHNALEQMKYNVTSSKEWRLKRKIEDLDFIQSKVIIFKDNAGQGKTNLLCDIAENVLLKRNIPSLFFTGYELDANDLYNSIAKRLFPDKNYNFDDIFSRIDRYCQEKETSFVILIDGLNENPNPQLLSQNLELFISDLMRYKHIKVILSCRTEYYKNNFSNLSNASFKNSLIQVDNVNNRLDEWHKKRLYETYLSYFDITVNAISDDVYKQLVDNFLLLRIFSEAYKGQTISVLTHIYKDELFQKYYEIESENINRRLSEKCSLPNFDIRNFFRLMIQYMIEHSCYENIPLDEIIGKEPQYRDLYVRFVDENILIRKDLDNRNGVFGDKELVNFTFDEFRDFLITDYLLSVIYPRNSQDFENFITQHIDKETNITEGCISFMFSMERKMNNKNLSNFVRAQNWYKEEFPYGIFDIQDSYIEDTDKEQLKQVFLSSPEISKQITLSLAYHRREEDQFPQLNIQFLFEIFNELTDEQFKSNIYPIYPDNYSRFDFYRSKSKLDKLLDFLEKELKEADFSAQPYRHNLFMYILYFMPMSYDVNYLYSRYWDKCNNRAPFTYILKCKSAKIKANVQQFIDDYEIQL